MSLTDMDKAHRRDMADEHRLRELKSLIQDFRADPPHRASPKTLSALSDAVDGLRRDAELIVAVWD